MTPRPYTRAALSQIAREAPAVETRRAALACLDALDALDIRRALDAGCEHHTRPLPSPVDRPEAVCGLGPAPEPAEGGAMPSFTVAPTGAR